MSVRGVMLAAWFGCAATAWASDPISGYWFLEPNIRAMQDDEFENPGMLAWQAGADLFRELRPDEEAACSTCHGENAEDLASARIARYPVYDEQLGGLVTLQERINHCWEIHLDRFPLPYDHRDLIVLETFVRHRARGEVISVQTDGPMARLLDLGKDLYNTRFGQINVACQHCHIQHQDQMLRGQRLSQGQANGFPVYRLTNGRITSLQQRLRQCFIAFRAEPFEPGSDEFKLLELFVMARGNGLPIETPAVRF